MVSVTTTIKVGKLAPLWQPADSEIVGKALLGRIRIRVQKKHQGSDDDALRAYTRRYAAWKSAFVGLTLTGIFATRQAKRERKTRLSRRFKGEQRKEMQRERREARTRARQASRGAERFFAGIGADSAGRLPVTLTLRNRHLRTIRIADADATGFAIEAPAPYAGVLEAGRPHLAPSPSDLKAVRFIALRILRTRARSWQVKK